jgi:hypothetical protein
MKARKPKPQPGKVSGVTTGQSGTHDEIGGKKTRKGYKTTYTPKPAKEIALPKSTTGGKRKVKKEGYVMSDRGGAEKVKEAAKRTDRKSMVNKNIEKTKIKSASGTKKVKTNLGSGRIDVKFKGKKIR